MKTKGLDCRKFFFMSLFFIAFIVFCVLPNANAAESNTYPERVVSLGPIITKTIYLLEADKKLIANTTYCSVPLDARLKEKIGSVIQMNVEKIISLKPDLVLANALSQQSQIKMLKRLGIRVIKFENPKTFSEMCMMTMRLGKVMGKAENAKKIIAAARKEVNAIRAVAEKLPRRKVFIQIGMKPLHTSIKETFINEYIEFAGGVNIALNEKSGVYSREKVLQQNPDVILIATMGRAKRAAEDEKERWMQFKAIHAARNNEIYILDSDIICSPTPVTFIKGLNSIVAKLHPDIIL